MSLAPWRELAHAYLATAEHYARRVVGTDLCDDMGEAPTPPAQPRNFSGHLRNPP